MEAVLGTEPLDELVGLDSEQLEQANDPLIAERRRFLGGFGFHRRPVGLSS
ncbi:hypothetical protein [Glycomyces arizonensis]|uniref:hypothetical protein n=1 Tax=Glycomyces arizonensis TaxID=256035 RepID=UPI001B7FD64F|nr:hypothetical protein [Glycomyces arizonensis]